MFFVFFLFHFQQAFVFSPLLIDGIIINNLAGTVFIHFAHKGAMSFSFFLFDFSFFFFFTNSQFASVSRVLKQQTHLFTVSFYKTLITIFQLKLSRLDQF